MVRPSRSSFITVLIALFFVAASAKVQPQPTLQPLPKPWPIRVVIVVTSPEEFELWGAREHLSEAFDVPGVPQPVHANAEHTVLGIVSGATLINASASMMALGLDPRFDLTHAYFIVNGIAGVDPEDASIGSAAWANFVVGDVMSEIDIREAPTGWPYGLFPAGSTRPSPTTVGPGFNLFALNPKLVAWAFEQTRGLKLPDDSALAAFRAAYSGYPNAQRPPFVLLGDDFASDHYWHGKILTQFANDFVRLYTGGKGNFVMAEMEDSGIVNALARLDSIHRVDINRVLVLRTASNYSMQAPGSTALDSIASPYPDGGKFAYQSAWLCGSTVLHSILSHWDIAFERNPVLDVQITSAQQREMPDNAKGFKHLLFGILQTPVWRGFRQVVRHQSVDRWNLLVLGCIAAISMWLIFKRRTNAASRSADENERSLLASVSGHHSAHAVNKIDGLFSELQIDTMRLASDLRKFFNELAPKPDTDWNSGDKTDPDWLAGKIAARRDLVSPWSAKLQQDYSKEFAPRVIDLMHRLVEADLDVSAIQPYAAYVESEQKMLIVARALDDLAVELNYHGINLPDDDSDSISKYGNMNLSQ
ncbi:purine-nucleoside phosphorylase [Acidicapsa acidisoli]|uniref:purine-nucleoside phosphorylase n=1 Tax=Acidicapsa acidisoli TaxID=1615681 RepID=UPI0021E0E55E|nr:purine nucleoside permease [Acidicapsa acidisoli]